MNFIKYLLIFFTLTFFTVEWKQIFSPLYTLNFYYHKYNKVYKK